MNFTEFCNQVLEDMTDYFKERAKISLVHAKKLGGLNLTGIGVVRPDFNASPTIYLDDFYRRYKEGISYGEVLEEIIGASEGTKSINVDLAYLNSFEEVKEDLFLRIVNPKVNEQILEEVPHIPFLDLEVVFVVELPEEILKNSSILIKKEMLRHWDITEEELYEIAKDNSFRKRPLVKMSMENLMRGMIEQEIRNHYVKYMEHESLPKDYPVDFSKLEPFTEARLQKEVSEALKKLFPENEELPIYVLSNQNRCYGAAVMCYAEALKHIAEEYDSSFYLLPSSVHEVILVPVSENTEAKHLSAMVSEVNRECVEQVDYLSDSVYFFDKDKAELMIYKVA